jgi:hypothetical protein
VARARRAGGLRPDVTVLDIAWLIETLGKSGPAEPGSEDEVIRQRLTAIAIDGLRAPATGRLPGKPPSTSHYERRWARHE